MPVISSLIDFLEAVSSRKIFDEAYTNAKQRMISSLNARKLSISKADYREAVAEHVSSISNQVSQIQIRDMRQAKSIYDIYVNLNIRLSAKKWDDYKARKKHTIELQGLFSNKIKHVILLGDPGAGKTTSLKKLCSMMIFNDVDYLAPYRFPIFIRLRELKANETLFERLSVILSVRLESHDQTLTKEERYEYLKRFLQSYINELGTILLIDGLDEIAQSKTKTILDEIEQLTTSLTRSKLILTSRSGPFERVISCCTIFELDPLDKPQIEEFVSKWFVEKRLSTKFKKELFASPYFEGHIKPLDLAQLCAIFKSDEKIPLLPRDIYRKRIRLYLEEWDKENDVKRDTKYSQLDVENKIDFFSHFAFQLSDKYDTKVYTETELGVVYKNICDFFELPKREMKAVIGELESHTGLIVTSGYDKVEFYHKTTQEYFTAYYIHKLPEIPILEKFPNEFAIATTLCPDPNLYFSKLIFNFLHAGVLDGEFLTTYINRLILERVRFKEDPFLIIPLLFAYAHNYIIVHKTRYQCLEKDMGYQSPRNEIGRAMRAFIKGYFPSKLKNQLLDFYQIGSTETDYIKILYPKKDPTLGDFGKQFLEFHDLLKTKVLITDKYLSLLGFQ